MLAVIVAIVPAVAMSWEIFRGALRNAPRNEHCNDLTLCRNGGEKKTLNLGGVLK